MALYYTLRHILRRNDPSRHIQNQRKLNLERRNPLSESETKLLKEKLSRLKLTEHEEVIASEIMINVNQFDGFNEIGGLESIIQGLNESVIFPSKYPHLFQSNGKSNLLRAPRGVLLYGPPGCGKTMLAKALAKESGATFINLHVSTLTEKWFGESQKLVHALFGLAQKMAPTIVFIDEIDSFLRERRMSDHETTNMMKAEFLGLWDGLNSNESHFVIILGATNRPQDLDKAVLRRMPYKFYVKRPNAEQRRKILNLLLANLKLDPKLDVNDLVENTSGYSGSDLKEICRNAAMRPLREYLRTQNSTLETLDPEQIVTRPLTYHDFFDLDGGDSLDSVYKEGEIDFFEFGQNSPLD
ncbi:hypothetical protein HMI54_015074 [Coelomomyces lativittatus]|nr:hypothetical protein HMI54_015074 [Coelomomyces lativittatus]